MFLFKKESDNFVFRFKEMIQRIQSIYLLVIAILSIGLTFTFNLWKIGKEKVFAFDLFSNEAIFEKLVPVFFVLSALVALITIFQFRKRQLQFVLGRVIILINLFLLGILIYLSLNLPGEVSSEKGIGMFIPIVVVLLSVMANKAIKKDEDLVKSVDRLR
tara:strand:- start:6583 stop:7062 length:480 start_codon:yes stop_codon:yes gene_type:complete